MLQDSTAGKHRHGCDFAVLRTPAGVLADEMGMGKTIQTVALVAALQQHKGCSGTHLVLAPKAVLPNWVCLSWRWQTIKFSQTADIVARVVVRIPAPD